MSIHGWNGYNRLLLFLSSWWYSEAYIRHAPFRWLLRFDFILSQASPTWWDGYFRHTFDSRAIFIIGMVLIWGDRSHSPQRVCSFRENVKGALAWNPVSFSLLIIIKYKIRVTAKLDTILRLGHAFVHSTGYSKRSAMIQRVILDKSVTKESCSDSSTPIFFSPACTCSIYELHIGLVGSRAIKTLSIVHKIQFVQTHESHTLNSPKTQPTHTRLVDDCELFLSVKICTF